MTSAGALAAACAATAEHTLIGQGPYGSVYLERLASRGATAKYSGPLGTFQATHPVALSSDLLARALASLRIGLAPTEARESFGQAAPLFSAETVAHLAPLISSALSQATPDQRVRFTAQSEEGTEVHGTLFVHRPLLHVTISRYRVRNIGPPVGLDRLELSSIHQSARRADHVPQSWLLQETGLPSTSLDYQIMETLMGPRPDQPQPRSPSAAGSPASREALPSTPSETESLREMVTKQAEEIEKLKKEVETLRRQSPPGRRPSPKQSDQTRPALTPPTP